VSVKPENPQVVVTDEEIFEAHVAGKLSVQLTAPLDTQRALSIAYTPGVAQVSRAIIVFALSNPDPEINPDVAARHAAVVATGRSDFPNQINNVLAFPGVFRGALDAGARRITETMKVAAAEAIFSVASDDLAPDRIVPSPFDPRVGPAVASAVAAAATEI
jgi:malate dehydrogenase (oxaloacetate-decarboxylating)